MVPEPRPRGILGLVTALLVAFLVGVAGCGAAGIEGATATPGPNSGTGWAELTWDPSQSPDVAGYRVYFGPASGHYQWSITLGDQTTYTVTGLGPGTYYFVVTAYDRFGVESDVSNEVSKTIDT